MVIGLFRRKVNQGAASLVKGALTALGKKETGEKLAIELIRQRNANPASMMVGIETELKNSIKKGIKKHSELIADFDNQAALLRTLAYNQGIQMNKVQSEISNAGITHYLGQNLTRASETSKEAINYISSHANQFKKGSGAAGTELAKDWEVTKKAWLARLQLWHKQANGKIRVGINAISSEEFKVEQDELQQKLAELEKNCAKLKKGIEETTSGGQRLQTISQNFKDFWGQADDFNTSVLAIKGLSTLEATPSKNLALYLEKLASEAEVHINLLVNFNKRVKTIEDIGLIKKDTIQHVERDETRLRAKELAVVSTLNKMKEDLRKVAKEVANRAA